MRLCTPIRTFLDIDIDSSCANWLYIANIISELTSAVSIFSFSKYTDIPSVFTSRTAVLMISSVRYFASIIVISAISSLPFKHSIPKRIGFIYHQCQRNIYGDLYQNRQKRTRVQTSESRFITAFSIFRRCASVIRFSFNSLSRKFLHK